MKVEGRSIFNYGDVSTISFHATKLFHTIEGGAIITKDKKLAEKMYLYRSFGHIGDDYYTKGINAKNSEFHAAMGLSNLPYVADIMDNRKERVELYRHLFKDSKLFFPEVTIEQSLNYAYFPVVFDEEDTLLKVKNSLFENGINTRRYFYPSLNNLSYLKEKYSCPVSENISKRVLCLPLYYDLDFLDIERICKIINTVCK